MGNGIYTALAGAVAQSEALDVTANNVANASTAGFRAERVSFHEQLTRATGNRMVFVGATGGKTDGAQGALRQTGAPLDAALVGDAWFAVDTPRGVRYTRDGAFRTDAGGMIVTSVGLAVRARGGGNLVIPPGAATVAIGGDGTVEADGEAIGQLELARFAPSAMVREGESLMIARGPAQAVGADVEVVGGAIEQSDFEIVRGVVDLVRVSRTYEALHRMIERYRDIDSRTARDIGGPG